MFKKKKKGKSKGKQAGGDAKKKEFDAEVEAVEAKVKDIFEDDCCLDDLGVDRPEDAVKRFGLNHWCTLKHLLISEECMVEQIQNLAQAKEDTSEALKKLKRLRALRRRAAASFTNKKVSDDMFRLLRSILNAEEHIVELAADNNEDKKATGLMKLRQDVRTLRRELVSSIL